MTHCSSNPLLCPPSKCWRRPLPLSWASRKCKICWLICCCNASACSLTTVTIEGQHKSIELLKRVALKGKRLEMEIDSLDGLQIRRQWPSSGLPAASNGNPLSSFLLCVWWLWPGFSNEQGTGAEPVSCVAAAVGPGPFTRMRLCAKHVLAVLRGSHML